MSMKWLKTAMLGTVATTGLALVGCSSTGETTPVASNSKVPSTEYQERYTDEKGRYRPDWAAGINRPPEYPRTEQ